MTEAWTDEPPALTVNVQRSPSGAYFVTCPQHRGLITVEQSLSAALASVVPALQDLLSVGPPHPDPKAFDGIDVT